MNNPGKFRSILLFLLALSLVFLSAARSPRNLDTVNAAQVATPTVAQDSAAEQPVEVLEIGNTDGIMIWGTLLVIIVLVAVVWHWPDWSKPKSKTPQ